ncbi:MAG: hypothetical protein JO319_19830 [Acidobacteriaceae bacterium]|nr:hypothetical protein [Acidobacteriaceae bacterium]
MNFFFNRIIIASLLSTAVTFAAGNGSGEHASFHLPVQAHWGTAVLQPGDYRMVSPDLAFGQPTFVVRGADSGAFVIPLVTEASRVSKDCYLKLQQINGTYFVTEYLAGPAGTTYTFAAPKNGRHQSFAQNHTTLVAVTNSTLR